jgi:hypothetical protein
MEEMGTKPKSIICTFISTKCNNLYFINHIKEFKTNINYAWNF